ncbi:hypothetical protein [Streptomyces sp. NPDC096030]|uniref:hypothetical protein n=1 Tax=Streptomyces sp. NPDC096030 TaxID=3155423 RepID=UPI0033331970
MAACTVTSGVPEEEATSPTPTVSVPADPVPTELPASPVPTDTANAGAADVQSAVVEDRSENGVTNLWLKIVVRNQSAEEANYSIDWEAVDAAGVRVDNGTMLVTDVAPGQTATEESPTLLDRKDVQIRVTSVERG